jgi:hypothetical protein
VIRTFIATSRRHGRDILLGAALALVAVLGSLQGASRIDPVFLHPAAEDAWFQSDMPRVYQNMTRRGSDHYRASVHPLFAFAVLPPVGALWKGLGLEPLTAVRAIVAAVAALWAATLFAILRLAGLARLDASLFTLLAAVSAAAVFWFTVPDSYGFGSLSILFAVAVVAAAQHVPLKERWYVTASVGSFAFTVTNWMAGIASSLVDLKWKRAAQVTVNAFFIATALWLIQRHFIPSAGPFLSFYMEQDYVLTPESGGPLAVLRSFIFHSVVMPAIATVERINPPGLPIMSVQHSSLWTGWNLPTVASGVWTVLLLLGLWGFAAARTNRTLRVVIGMVLAGQLALHLLYGEETFLYALHFAPLLILLAAFAATTRLRPIAVVLTVVLIGSAGANNVMRWSDANAFFQGETVKGRGDVLREMITRPNDPWPRGVGHVVLARPGSAENEKSYHEPGGSFSPVPGSFGVGVWARDEEGQWLTSDSIPLEAIDQSLDLDRDSSRGSLAAIATDTAYYRARWELADPTGWRLALENPKPGETELSVVIRSVGPAGGPIHALEWDGTRLRVNERWQITVEPRPSGVTLGDEREPGWKSAQHSSRQWRGNDGWGFARIALGGERRWTIRITDTRYVASERYRIPVRDTMLNLSLPDPRFSESVHAQVAHLLMSLVGNQTRTADPVNAPVPWQRTGAYIIAALVRAGEGPAAKELSRYLAENDFYGGFGAEADAPGLATWALRQVAAHLNDRDYDKWLWTHVRRKADLIMTMLSAKEPVRRESPVPIVPRHSHNPENDLVADAARDGLIIGRMDYHRPVLYVNAVSYRGLMDAAWLAERVGERELAAVWRDRAQRLSRDWAAAFRPPESENDRTYITALWPTWVAASQRDLIRKNLLQRWEERRDDRGDYRWPPLWTYFELAEAHQWLYLGNHTRAWATLIWFWEHQASPGLYTWWEDRTEGNSYYGWTRLRGWVSPPHVTPHYWTSAEMLLLQLDMLAYVDESGHEPALVIGAGVPSDWTTAPMSVGGVGTSLGFVSWTWRDGVMFVVIRGGPLRKARVRLGETFPAGASLRVEYRP